MVAPITGQDTVLDVGENASLCRSWPGLADGSGARLADASLAQMTQQGGDPLQELWE